MVSVADNAVCLPDKQFPLFLIADSQFTSVVPSSTPLPPDSGVNPKFKPIMVFLFSYFWPVWLK